METRSTAQSTRDRKIPHPPLILCPKGATAGSHLLGGEHSIDETGAKEITVKRYASKRRLANREYARRARSRRRATILELSKQIQAFNREREELLAAVRGYNLGIVKLRQGILSLTRAVTSFHRQNSALQGCWDLLSSMHGEKPASTILTTDAA